MTKYLTLLLCVLTLAGCSLTTKTSEPVINSGSTNNGMIVNEQVSSGADLGSGKILSTGDILTQTTGGTKSGTQDQPRTQKQFSNDQLTIGNLESISNWFFTENTIPNDAVSNCMNQKAEQSGKPNGTYRVECEQNYIQQNLISKDQACQKTNGLYEKTYLQVSGSQGDNALTLGFYKTQEQLYYIVHTSKDTIPNAESQDRMMYLYQYDCNTTKSNQIHQFSTNGVSPYFTIQKIFSDKILLKDLPYEGPYNGIPYEGYIIYDTNTKSLQRINILTKSFEYGSTIQLLKIGTDTIDKAIIEDSNNRCSNKDICQRWYEINSITNNKVIFTMSIFNEDQNKIYKRTYQLTY